VLELSATRASVIGCYAAPEALEALATIENATSCRVAPDEVMLIVEPGSAEELVRTAADLTTGTDPDAVALDTTDGWAIWTLAGDATRGTFACLSAVALPAEGFVQGSVAHVPVKVVVLPDRLHLLVPSMWHEHLRERILHDCASLGVQEVPGSVDWTAPVARKRRRGK